jgi:hypothetical protein
MLTTPTNADFKLEVAKWGAPTSVGSAAVGATVTFSLDAFPTQFRDVALRAMADWSQYANIAFTQVGAAFSPQINFSCAAIDGPGGTLAACTYSFPGGQTISHAEIKVDTGENYTMSAGGAFRGCADNSDLFSVLLHEVGHAIGIEHYGATGTAIMNAYNSPTKVLDLTASDIHAVQYLYGAKPGAPAYDARTGLVQGTATPVAPVPVVPVSPPAAPPKFADILLVGENLAPVAAKAGQHLNPVTVLFNPNNGDYRFALSEAEVKTWKGTGFVNDGIQFASADPFKDGSVPLYRLYNSKTGLDTYTTNFNEYMSVSQAGTGWMMAGAPIHVWTSAGDGHDIQLHGLTNTPVYVHAVTPSAPVAPTVAPAPVVPAPPVVPPKPALLVDHMIDGNSTAPVEANGEKLTGITVFFNQATGDHIFAKTANDIKLNGLIHADYVNGGLQFSTPTLFSKGTVAVYELYNTKTKHYIHTIDVNEYNTLPTKDASWMKAGAPFAAYSTKAVGHDFALNGLTKETLYVHALTPEMAMTKVGSDMSLVEGTAADGHEVYRFLDTVTGDHFLTASVDEAAHVQGDMPWFQAEGVAFSVPGEGAGSVDVHRFLDERTGSHFYTASAEEKSIVERDIPGFRYEGVAFRALAADEVGADVFRFHDAKSGNHFYTASVEEKAAVERDLPNYRYEGVAFRTAIEAAGADDHDVHGADFVTDNYMSLVPAQHEAGWHV